MNQKFMQAALTEAQKAFDKGEIPIGAIIVKDNNIIASAFNSCESENNALKHAELKVIEQTAAKLNNWRLSDCDLYVTLEPCPMCLGALFQARVRSLIFGCPDHKRNQSQQFPSLKGQAKISDNNHTIIIKSGILENECSQILKNFFKMRRSKN